MFRGERDGNVERKVKDGFLRNYKHISLNLPYSNF